MNGRSNGDVDRVAVKDFLLSLPLRARVELFNEVLQQFQELELDESGIVIYKNAYMVAQLTFIKRKNELRGGPADTLPLALPVTAEGGYISDTVNQNGGCDICGTESIGFSKSSICPACGSTIEMT